MGKIAAIILVVFAAAVVLIFNDIVAFNAGREYDEMIAAGREYERRVYLVIRHDGVSVTASQADPDPTTSTSASVPTDTPVPTSPPTPAYRQVGTDVIVSEARWFVFSAEDLGNELTSDNPFIDPERTAGKFIQVRFQVENRSSDLLSFGGIPIRDSAGREFSSYSGSYGFIPDGENCIFENLNPNVPKDCTFIYEVATDASGLLLVVTDLEPFESGEDLVYLGF